MAVTRLSYMSIRALDLTASEKHYTDVVGLRVTGRRSGQVYLQAHESQDHHCIILNASDRAGLDHAGFKVSDINDLMEAEIAASDWGLATRRVASGDILGQGDGLMITLPSGHIFNLFYHSEKIGYSYGMKDPDIILDHVDGISPVTHLDHALLAGNDCDKSVKFLMEALDFNLTETILGPDGSSFAFFLTTSSTIHNLAFAPGPPNSLHHIAFYVNDRADVIRRVDMLKRRKITTLDYGISRHGIGGVTTTYFFDPSGNRNEFQCGIYEAPTIRGNAPPIVWAGEHIPRGAFYYERAVPANFFEVVT
ncbi:VOC family protein [Rugosibacter aromaticivorans]|uniref:VOC family protein n=1 Tax=Rugosibacter aromaticivorans TaxID=1565605 RepID=UPI000AF7F816|nr:VOC family protein [Rugosibacter aromaticivorans]ART35804.1 B110 [uncultured bacterium]